MKSKKCPECGSRNIAKILYGLIAAPEEKLNKQLSDGKVVLGGYCVSNENCHCNDCKFRFS